MKERDLWLGLVLLVSLALCAYHLQWGLPQGNDSWAADSLGPITALGVVARSFDGWNSGWFYFKYPLAYPLELVGSFAPYLTYLFLTRQWRWVKGGYPYGFVDPEHSLFVLALIGRVLNVVFVLGTVALIYGIARRLFDRQTGRLSAWMLATCYPVVYYAHTANLDAGYLFWLTLALYCGIVASDSRRPQAWIGLGVAAAMAVSTKEQAFAFLLPLPLLALGARARAEGSVSVWWGRPARIMAAAAIVTALLVNNVFLNPMGFVGRVAYLIGHPLHPVQARLAPVEFALFKGGTELTYLRQLWDAMDSGLGSVMAWLGAIGALWVFRRRRAAVWLLIPPLVHYYLSLRGLELIALRYTLPMMAIAAILASAVLIGARKRMHHPVLRGAASLVIIGVAALGLVRAVEVDWLLRTDTRYQAETWMAEHLAPGERGEVYQKAVYLPRFRSELERVYVPLSERSVAGLRQRRPDFVVVSSASWKSVTHRWNPDWRTTRELLTPVPAAVEMLESIEGGTAGYRPAAVFQQQPRWIRPRITSLNPRIAIYVRERK